MSYRNDSEAAILAMERDRTGNYGEDYDDYLMKNSDDEEDSEDWEWDY